MQKHAEIVVLGGSAAGLAAAITAHRQYPDKKVLLIRKEEKVLIPCGIPYIFGTVGTPDKNLIPDAILEKNSVELLIGKIESFDTDSKTVKMEDGSTVTYEKLIVGTGSLPVRPPIPGVEKDNIWTVDKDIPKLCFIQEKLKDVKNLIIIGGGFIGVEFADECHKMGVENVTIVEMMDHLLALSFDQDIAVEAEQILKARGINLKTGVRVTEFKGNGRVEKVALSDGTEIATDAVILGIGAAANAELAKAAGLKIGPTGAIAVNNYLETSVPGVFACGDCAEKISFFGGRCTPLRLASIACAEGRIAGANVFGTRRESIGTIGVWSTAIGDLALGCAGLTESMAKKAGYDYVVGIAEAPNRHPGCMPGGENIKVKVVHERRSGVILGAQMVGARSLGEMINAASVCIQKKMNFDDIACFQIGTHPALTASPLVYQLVAASEMALMKTRG